MKVELFKSEMLLRRYACVFLVGVLLIAGCLKGDGDWEALIREIRESYPTVQQASTAQVSEWMSREAGSVVLFDTRTREEFEISHIPTARHLPRVDLFEQHQRFVSPKTKIVTYCSVGYRSSAMAERLQAIGIKRVYNMEGSIFKWVNEGRPVVAAGPENVGKVHPFNKRWGRFLDLEYHADLP